VAGMQSRRNDVGIFTLTGIPMDFEGKYVFLYDYGDDNIIGVERLNSFTNDWINIDLILSKISNVEVRIPLWNLNDNNIRYSGNHSFHTIRILIFDKPQLNDDSDYDYLRERIFNSVQFENGNASKNWTDGISRYESR